MVLTAPEFVVAKFIQMLDQIDVAAKLQHRMLADRVMRSEEGAGVVNRRMTFECIGDRRMAACR